MIAIERSPCHLGGAGDREVAQTYARRQCQLGMAHTMCDEDRQVGKAISARNPVVDHAGTSNRSVRSELSAEIMPRLPRGTATTRV